MKDSRQPSLIGCTLRVMTPWPVWLHGLETSFYMQMMVIYFSLQLVLHTDVSMSF